MSGFVASTRCNRTVLGMLVALWQYDAEELLAGLLIFRLLYYLLPFALALAVLGIREVMLSMARRGDVGHR